LYVDIAALAPARRKNAETRVTTIEDARTEIGQSGLNPKLLAIDHYERALGLASASRLVVLAI
jgi:hypothetical protein